MKLGHFVSLLCTTCKETLQNLEKVIISNELLRCKEARLPSLVPEDRIKFVKKWKMDNMDLMTMQFGARDDNLRFVKNGIFFAPSFSFVQKTVSHLQKVFMADACHLQFGKYMPFSCYGVTANCNISLGVFAISFGNENTSTWRQFWKYVLEIHLYVDSGEITIITDQDKGQKNTIVEYLCSVSHFHCSWHRGQNIIKMCGGGVRKTAYLALWMVWCKPMWGKNS